MQAIFQKSFPRVFPEFLREGRRQLSLDGYNKDFQLAFEHQGIQHYRRFRHFHRSERDFDRQLKRDQEKLARCAFHGVRVIYIPEVPRLTPVDDLQSVIRKECERVKVDIPRRIEESTVDVSRIYGLSALEPLHQIAFSRGGACLSNRYLGDRVKLLWRCAEGHEWEAMPNGVKKGSWCPLCYGNRPKPVEAVRQLTAAKGGELISDRTNGKRRFVTVICSAGHTWETTPRRLKRGGWCPTCDEAKRLTINNMREAAVQRGGLCLSYKYVNSVSKLHWRCQLGHEWDAPYASIQQGRWCPKCGHIAGGDKQRDTIDKMRATALARGGRCLSTDYVNSTMPLRWRCAHGHEWAASPGSVSTTSRRKGSWCPRCAHAALGRAQRDTIEGMRLLAAERGGKCLSKVYETQRSHLEWECANGHRWLALSSNIKKGRWCPMCAHRKKLTIEEMQEIAALRGGECLSESYINVNTKLLWQCSKKHSWWAAPEKIKGTPRKRGTWCPKCRGNVT